MKILHNGYKEYHRYYHVLHDSECKLYKRNVFHLHLPLRSHEQDGECAMLLNSLSGEILLLNETEEQWWMETEKGIDISAIEDAAQCHFVNTLVGHDLIVSHDTDMIEVLRKGRKAANATERRRQELIEGYHTYVILSTTECNARCFYCYEKGTVQHRMKAETALDVARYIEKNYLINKKEASIQWFGGEPLYNVEAIDLISDYLNSHGIPFESKMISNGYLLTPDVLQRANDNWHLRYVQVTLDGREELYNRTKNYIYPKDTGISPYQRVVSNIIAASKTGLDVIVRFNVDLHNADELIQLADELKALIGDGNNKITAYSRALFSGFTHMHGEQREAIIALSQFRLLRHLLKLGLAKIADKKVVPLATSCMADDIGSTLILPDGKQTKCEHYLNTLQYSDIYGTFFDKDAYDRYFEVHTHHESCNDCPLMPLCYHLKVCESSDRCNPYERKTHIIERKAAMLVSYKTYRHEEETLSEAPVALADGMKIRNLKALQSSAPADIWANSHAEYAATLPQGTWSMHFAYKFNMDIHHIQEVSVARLDQHSSTRKWCGDTSPLRESLSAIAEAYLCEHPDDILVMHQTPAGQRLAARWYEQYNAVHPNSVTLLQGEAIDKVGNLQQLSVYVANKCKDFSIVCKALAKQMDAFV